MKPIFTATLVVAATLCSASAAAQDAAPAEGYDPFFGLSVGAKGGGGGDLWTDPPNEPVYALMFDDDTGGWGAGGGLYTELRILWGYLGLEIDLLFETNTVWHEITWNEVLETQWILKWTSMRVPILLEGNLESEMIRVSLGFGPEFVVGLGADTELEVTSGEQYVSAGDLADLRSTFATEKQTDTYLTVGLGLAVKVWRLAISLDLRAGFNMTQPEDHDDRITYHTDSSGEYAGLDVISSSTMDFRALLGVAWEHGFDI
jgi:hypothetical protein